MSNYYSVDEILCEDERIPLKWISDAKGVGHLDPSSGLLDIPSGTSMDLPLWLAEDLRRLGLIDIEFPQAYSKKSREDLIADATAARLREKSPFFYAVGRRLCPLLANANDAVTLATDVRNILADRAAGILERARSGLGQDVSAYRGLLTDLEQRLFDVASAFTASTLAWRREEASIMRPPAASLSASAGPSVNSEEAAHLSASTLPRSRGQKRQRSLLESSGL
jgi:GINS complex subunit 3